MGAFEVARILWAWTVACNHAKQKRVEAPIRTMTALMFTVPLSDQKRYLSGLRSRAPTPENSALAARKHDHQCVLLGVDPLMVAGTSNDGGAAAGSLPQFVLGMPASEKSN
jgi:hypothetical protein